MVLLPDVKVVPLTVITYPVFPLVEVAITEVPLLVEVVEAVPSPTVEPDTVPQLVPVMDVPVQKTRDSSTVRSRFICVAVLAATTPVSTPVVQASSEYVAIRA